MTTIDFIEVINYLMDFFIVFLAVLAALFIVVAYKAHKDSQKPDYEDAKPNNGNKPIHPHKVIGREKELRRLVRQILWGESGAIIGSARSGKTLMLDYLRDENPEHQAMLYGDKAERLIFSYLDISAFEEKYSPTQFWEDALKPLQDKTLGVSSALAKAHKNCQANNFETFYLDKLLAQMKQDDWRLVLMIDGFDGLLQHSKFKNNASFFGGLRTLASSRGDSPLVLIITGHISLYQFHKMTKSLNPTSSPYFNFMEPGETLGALSESDIDKLLRQSSVHPFTEGDQAFIKDIAGGHPYFLREAAVALEDSYEDKDKEPLKTAKEKFYDRVKNTLNDTLQSWPPDTCHAFVAVVQKDEDISRFKMELEYLEKLGFVIQDKENGGWRVRAQVFSDFVAGEDWQKFYQK